MDVMIVAGIHVSTQSETPWKVEGCEAGYIYICQDKSQWSYQRNVIVLLATDSISRKLQVKMIANVNWDLLVGNFWYHFMANIQCVLIIQLDTHQL